MKIKPSAKNVEKDGMVIQKDYQNVYHVERVKQRRPKAPLVIANVIDVRLGIRVMAERWKYVGLCQHVKSIIRNRNRYMLMGMENVEYEIGCHRGLPFLHRIFVYTNFFQKMVFSI